MLAPALISCEDYSKVPPEVLAARLRADRQRQIIAEQNAQDQTVEMLRRNNEYIQEQQQEAEIMDQLQPPPQRSWTNPQGRSWTNSGGY